MKFFASMNGIRISASILGLWALAGCGVSTQSHVTSDSSAPAVVEFHIKSGTAGKSWNTRETMVVAHLGDTVRIINDDSIDHRLHTNGAPCPHGPTVVPGGTFDCLVTKAFDPGENSPLYDHNFGSVSQFWIKAN